jgi:hypothetical protein
VNLLGEAQLVNYPVCQLSLNDGDLFGLTDAISTEAHIVLKHEVVRLGPWKHEIFLAIVL